MEEVVKLLKMAFNWLPLPDVPKIILLVVLLLSALYVYLRNRGSSGESSE